MLERLTPARRNVALLLLLALVLWFAWSVRAALNPLLVAFLLAYMLHPMVLALERRGWSRRRAVNLIYAAAALLTLLLSLGLWLQGRALWRDLVRDDGLIERIEARSLALTDRARAAAGEWLPDVLGTADEPAVRDAAARDEAGGPEVGSLLGELREWLQSGAGASAARQAGTAAAGGLLTFGRRLFGSLVTFLTMVFLVPVYAWFLLFELERISAWVRGYVPVEQRSRVARIGDQMAEVLASFFRGRLLVCFLKGLLLAGLLALLGVPYAFLLGMLAGVLSLIPFVGPFVAYALVFLLSLTMGVGEGAQAGGAEAASAQVPFWGAVWRTALAAAAGELVEGYVLLPKILGDSLGLHPLVVLVALTVAGSALGMFGLLIALPLTAAVVILAREIVLPALADWAEGRRAAAGSPPAPPADEG